MDRNGKATFGGGVLTAGYRPGVYFSHRRLLRDQGKVFTWADVEDMRADPIISFGLEILQAPIAGAKWEIRADDDIAAFIDQQLNRIWQHDLSKILTINEYGTAGGETVYRLDPNSGWEVDGLRDIHLNDLQPVIQQGTVVGLNVKNVPGKSGLVPLPLPRFWWIANQPRFGSVYGHGRLAAAWEPWQEKTAQKGAKDSRRTWYFKNAYRGGMIRHPMGTLELGEGVTRSCEEYAREILEKFETGGILVLPNYRDEKGEYAWTFEPPATHGDLNDLREYVIDLSDEQWTGMGIPVEVVKAADTGSGWSGRSVPLLVFLGSLDRVFAAILQALDRQCIWHLVRVNFGQRAYEIEPVSLVPKNTDPQDPQGPAGQGQPDDGQGGGGQDGSLVPYVGKRGGQGQKNLQTGRITYGGQPLQLSHVRLSDENNPWSPYVGRRGGKGWKNTATGRIVYGGNRPGTRGKAVVGGKTKPERMERPQVADVAAKVKALLGSGKITADHVKDLADELMHMTVADLGKLKTTLGLKASGAKAVLAKKLAEKALAGIETAKPKPKEVAKPKAEPKPTAKTDTRHPADRIADAVDAAPGGTLENRAAVAQALAGMTPAERKEALAAYGMTEESYEDMPGTMDDRVSQRILNRTMGDTPKSKDLATPVKSAPALPQKPEDAPAVSEGRVAVTEPAAIGNHITTGFQLDRVGGNLVQTDVFANHMKRSIAPTLTPQQFKGLMQHLWDHKQIEMKVLNEVRQAGPQWRDTAIQQGENFYGFVSPSRGATPESIGKAAKAYLDKEGIETSEEDFNPYGPGYDKHGRKLT